MTTRRLLFTIVLFLWGCSPNQSDLQKRQGSHTAGENVRRMQLLFSALDDIALEHPKELADTFYGKASGNVTELQEVIGKYLDSYRLAQLNFRDTWANPFVFHAGKVQKSDKAEFTGKLLTLKRWSRGRNGIDEHAEPDDIFFGPYKIYLRVDR